jgi:hypothetical protein
MRLTLTPQFTGMGFWCPAILRRPASDHQGRQYMAPETQDRAAGLNRMVSSSSAP